MSTIIVTKKEIYFIFQYGNINIVDWSGNMSNILGKRIKTYRNKKGITQKELADKIGVSNAVMSRYESGTRSPDFDKLKLIANELDVSIDYLLDHDNNNTDSFLMNHAEGFKELPLEEQKKIEQSLLEQAEFLIAKAKKNR
ncbi:XRE family transcriptional regulator [Macrococcoides goetzii]|nr:XRE family transcriptional regulator [Macrococcus goetzii]